MKFSVPMKVILGVFAVLVVLRIMTPSPEQQMIDQMNQQNQMMMQQMQSQLVDPFQAGYTAPGYYQESGQAQHPAYQNTGYYNGGQAQYAQPGHQNAGDDWQW